MQKRELNFKTVLMQVSEMVGHGLRAARQESLGQIRRDRQRASGQQPLAFSVDRKRRPVSRMVGAYQDCRCGKRHPAVYGSRDGS